MTSKTAFVLLGFGLGALVVASRSSTRREPSLRDQAIEAQRLAAWAAKRARELTNRWSASLR